MLTGLPISGFADRLILRSMGLDVGVAGETTLFGLRSSRPRVQWTTILAASSQPAPVAQIPVRLTRGDNTSGGLRSIDEMKRRFLKLQVAAVLAEIRELLDTIARLRAELSRILRELDFLFGLSRDLRGTAQSQTIERIHRIRILIIPPLEKQLADALAALNALFAKLDALDPAEGLRARTEYYEGILRERMANTQSASSSAGSDDTLSWFFAF